jgi:hypothetical protein
MKGSFEKYGDASLSIAVGEFGFRFEGLDGFYREKIRERYGPFAAEAKDSDFMLEVFKGGEAYIADDTGFLKLEENTEDGRRILLSTNFKGLEADSQKRGKIFISPNSSHNGFLTALENYFRWIVAYELVKRGGFLLHSAGVVKDGGAHLFFGNSGDGKSTIASFSEGRGAKMLSDDLIIVVPKKGGFHAFGAPFCGVLPQENKEKGDYPVRGCYRLRKASETKLKHVSKGEALGLIVPSCLCINNQKARNEMLLPAVMRFLETVAFYELLFRKDDAFWELL